MEAEGTAENSIDLRFEKAASLMKCTRGLMVPEAMRTVGFTSDEADDRCKRMWIHRRVKKNDKNRPTSVSLQLDRDEFFVSLLGDYLSTSLGNYPAPAL